jgi:RNA polymerase sigma-70 factor (ECF subfamily)
MPDDPRAAFERAALPFLPSVAFLAERLCGGAGPDADDLAQETFLKAFASFGRFESGTDLRKWLLTIALNAFRDRMRRKGRDALSIEGEGIDAPAPDPGHVLNLNEVVDDRLRRALDALPEASRTVLVLAVIEGLSRKEIADMLGCAEGTVRSILSRAKAGLRRALG